MVIHGSNLSPIIHTIFLNIDTNPCVMGGCSQMCASYPNRSDVTCLCYVGVLGGDKMSCEGRYGGTFLYYKSRQNLDGLSIFMFMVFIMFIEPSGYLMYKVGNQLQSLSFNISVEASPIRGADLMGGVTEGLDYIKSGEDFMVCCGEGSPLHLFRVGELLYYPMSKPTRPQLVGMLRDCR